MFLSFRFTPIFLQKECQFQIMPYCHILIIFLWKEPAETSSTKTKSATITIVRTKESRYLRVTLLYIETHLC